MSAIGCIWFSLQGSATSLGKPTCGSWSFLAQRINPNGNTHKNPCYIYRQGALPMQDGEMRLCSDSQACLYLYEVHCTYQMLKSVVVLSWTTSNTGHKINPFSCLPTFPWRWKAISTLAIQSLRGFKTPLHPSTRNSSGAFSVCVGNKNSCTHPTCF